jgi:hypothetical protein
MPELIDIEESDNEDEEDEDELEDDNTKLGKSLIIEYNSVPDEAMRCIHLCFLSLFLLLPMLMTTRHMFSSVVQVIATARLSLFATTSILVMWAPQATFISMPKFAGVRKLLLLPMQLEVHTQPAMPWEIEVKLTDPLLQHLNMLGKEKSAIVTASTQWRNHSKFSPHHDDTNI